MEATEVTRATKRVTTKKQRRVNGRISFGVNALTTKRTNGLIMKT